MSEHRDSRAVAGRRGLVVLPAHELAELLQSADLLRQDETGIAGAIRILRRNDRILVQEQVPETKELVVSEFPSLEEAERFVAERLSTYDRMWDGCGCKIDYFR